MILPKLFKNILEKYPEFKESNDGTIVTLTNKTLGIFITYNSKTKRYYFQDNINKISIDTQNENYIKWPKFTT